MSASLFIKNQQRTYPINIRCLRFMTRELLRDHLWIEDFDLGIYIVRAPRMAKVNQTYLRHEGSTDVITFNYGSESSSPIATKPRPSMIHGELFICIDDAILHARRFRTTWQGELVRYVIHGILHLCGYDDLNPSARRIMKREEGRLLKKLRITWPPAKLGKPLRISND